ncbi:hypothetical protein OJ997_05645 [Solirubrobacter phytolaccae]|uniref:CYTH domain-containing protein n=1 Tax=Solirubrobacter phytolaccae TaxID=1404360 RepID=A0A9X3N4U9_9ACTN|nr:hypothetical protein [Solirubrobacter phytolaccae]MDA0179768.1 hypothetical protein [Solirubrobacter phytolaccae]
MPIEIERKFLVDLEPAAWPVELLAASAADILQGYVTAPDGETEIRLRRICEVPAPGGVEDAELPLAPPVYKLAVKYDLPGSSWSGERQELEGRMTGEDFEKSWPLTAGSSLEKRRVSYGFWLPNDKMLAVAVDTFGGRLSGLQMIEVEFETRKEAEAFEHPYFFGREVTDDRRYRNRNLASADRLPSD